MTLPVVSLIVACRNEADYIEACLASLVANDYPADRLEVLVVDGMSDDGSRDRVHAIALRHPQVRLLDNPEGITPVAFNRGIRAARGAFIMIMGGHNSYAPDFVRTAVAYHGRYTADAVGGVIRTTPRVASRFGQAVAAALGHPVGVGPSRFRRRVAEPTWTDTVFGACYRREVFERVGLFNERLTRGQDMEFALRMRRAGCRTLLVPELVSDYMARSRPGDFWRHNWSNGVWAVLPFLYSPIRPVRMRHLAPLMLVVLLVGLGALAPWWTIARWGALVVGAGYLLTLLVGAAHAAVRSHHPGIMPYVVLAFLSLHIGYGLGSLAGVLRVVGAMASGKRRPTPEEAWPAYSRP